MNIRICALLFIALTLLVSCSKDRAGRIPDVPVNYRISLQEFQIKNENGVLLVDHAGIAGLILIHKPGDTYAAYDRCSSVDPVKRCAVTIDDSGLTATDPCSGAKFSLYDGTPVKAPATRSLKEYAVSRSSVELAVYN
jgi:nitrite reductase/ring-hydroxylating ferredoxin subunit